jgi:hypothetical protein
LQSSPERIDVNKSYRNGLSIRSKNPKRVVDYFFHRAYLFKQDLCFIENKMKLFFKDQDGGRGEKNK